MNPNTMNNMNLMEPTKMSKALFVNKLVEMGYELSL